MNKFEQAAKDFKPEQRPSWEHTIETYTEKKKKKQVDCALVVGGTFLIGFALVLISALV